MEGESIIEDWGEDEFLDGGDILEEMPDNDNAVISDEEHDDEAMEGQIEGNPPMIAQDDSIQGFFENQESVYAVRLSPTDGTTCICGGGDDKSYVWNSTSGEKLVELAAHKDSVAAVGWSEDGLYVASGSLDGSIIIMKNDGTHVCTLEGPNEVSWIDWHPKGHVLLAGGEDGTCWMFHIPSGQCMQVFSGHSESSTCGGFSPDGKLVATGSTDSSVIVWDPKTGSALQRWDPKRDGRFHQSGVSSLVFSADGSVIFSGGSDGTVNVLHTATGKFIQAIESHSDSVESMAVSKNMPWLATSSVDGTIHVWDISLMKIRFRVTHEDAVTKLVWTNSLMLVSGSMDATVRVTDGRTGNELKTYEGHQAGILDLDANDQIIVTCSDDGNCLVFPIPTN